METIDLGTTSKTKDAPAETTEDPWGSFSAVKKDKKKSPFSFEAEPEPVVEAPPPEPTPVPDPEPAATEDPWGFTTTAAKKTKKGKKGKVRYFQFPRVVARYRLEYSACRVRRFWLRSRDACRVTRLPSVRYTRLDLRNFASHKPHSYR
jgi:hypothetical protein